MLNQEEFVAGTHAFDETSLFALDLLSDGTQVVVSFDALKAEGPGYEGHSRFYDLQYKADPEDPAWDGVPSYTNILGHNQVVTLTNSAPPSGLMIHRGRTWLCE
jgi:hypothetical protein